MATSTDPPKDQTPPEPPANDGTPDPEEGFWKKMEHLMDQRISAGIDKKITDIRGTSQQRGSGRSTVPKIIADFVFGPEKSTKE